MQLIGHPLVPTQPLYEIKKVCTIKETPSNAVLLFAYDEDLIIHCQQNKLSFALHVTSIQEAIVGNGAGASILIASYEKAQELQALADHYLFDAKIAVCLPDDQAIEDATKLGVDMAILPQGIYHT